jgi:hypothetical protein
MLTTWHMGCRNKFGMTVKVNKKAFLLKQKGFLYIGEINQKSVKS